MSAKPEPGWHEGIDLATYLSWEAVSGSYLLPMAKTPAHANAQVLEPKDVTETMEVGSATHAAILEPEEFKKRWKKGPRGDKRLKAVKAEWDELREEFPNATILRAHQYEGCVEMAESCWLHPTAREILSGKGTNEMAVVWVDQPTGLLCKARFDRYTSYAKYPTVAEIKTSRDAGDFRFARDCANFGYHLKAAMYLEGIKEVTQQDIARRHIIIAVENVKPHCVAVYEFDESSLEAGRQLFRLYLDKFAECIQSGRWPGYPHGVSPLRIPEWAMRYDTWIADDSTSGDAQYGPGLDLSYAG